MSIWKPVIFNRTCVSYFHKDNIRDSCSVHFIVPISLEVRYSGGGVQGGFRYAGISRNRGFSQRCQTELAFSHVTACLP